MDIFDDDDDPATRQDYDTVEVDIQVDAPIEAVWTLVSEPGWWINDGPLGDHEVEQDEDGLFHVSDPEVGTWLVERADLDPMDVASFRWYPLAGDEFPEERTTRVEFSLSEQAGLVAVHVEEAGLSSVSPDEGVARQTWEDAQGMWERELAAAKEHLEGTWARR
ncbi:MAG: toxin [Propionibacterium sp.]|nr:toxin [Actinomyces sp.]MDN6794418.1 toxin [Propionibacterium sp.]